jgi:hypothetical protein
MGGKILLFFSLKNKRLEGQRESLFPKMPNLSLQIATLLTIVKKKAPVVKLVLLI